MCVDSSVLSGVNTFFTVRTGQCEYIALRNALLAHRLLRQGNDAPCVSAGKTDALAECSLPACRGRPLGHVIRGHVPRVQ